MKLKNIFAALAVAALLVPSCKKDDNKEVTYLYFDGSISFSLPSYVKAGDTFTFDINEISTLTSDKLAQGEEIRYYVTDPYTAVNDTLDNRDGKFTFTVLDTLGSFTLTVKGFCSGFVNSSCSATFVTIDNDLLHGSLTGTGIGVLDKHFTDPRDSNVYYYTQKGNLLWTRNNLGYAGSGIPYMESKVMDKLFGRFYSYDQAVGACPEDWRLPTESEWQALFDSYGGNAGELMADARFNDNAMWTYWREVRPTNGSGIGLLPVGYAYESVNGKTFGGSGAYAAFWTSSKENGLGVFRYINEQSSTIFRGTQSCESFYLPVRCVKEK